MSDQSQSSDEEVSLPGRERLLPSRDTIDWGCSMYRSWMPKVIRHAYLDLFASDLLPSGLHITREEFTCVCGETTSYVPHSIFLMTSCSNELCPMVHRCDIDEGRTTLIPYHFVQCGSCGEVEKGYGYWRRQERVRRELRTVLWIPNEDDWSEEPSVPPSSMEYRSAIPETRVEDLSNVGFRESVCMECWLKEYDIDPDQLRRNARHREDAGEKPFNHEVIEAQKRQFRSRVYRLSLFPVGVLLYRGMDLAQSWVGMSSRANTLVLLQSMEADATIPVEMMLIALQGISTVLVFVGILIWMVFLLRYMTAGSSAEST